MKATNENSVIDVDQLDLLLKLEPHSAEDHFMLGTAEMALADAALRKAGNSLPVTSIANFDAAVKHLERATNADPLHYKAFFNLGISRFELGRLYEEQDRALSKRDQELSLRRSRVEFVESRKALLSALDIVKNAKSGMRTSDLLPRHTAALCNRALGVLSLETGRFDEAIDLLNAALELEPKLEKVNYYKGLALYDQRRYAESIECFMEEQRQDDDDYLAWNDCGNSHFNMGDLEQSKHCYIQALKICDRKGLQVGFVLNNIAWCLLSREHPDDFEAEKYLQKVFESLGISISALDRPDYVKLDTLTLVAKRTLIQASALQGLMQYVRGSYDQASMFLSYSVSVAEHYSIEEAYPYLYLGNVHFRTGRYRDAEKSYSQAKKFESHYAELFDANGVAMCKNDKAHEALQEFQTSIKLKPSLVSGVLHLTRLQAYLDSGGKSTSESPRFIGYWSKSKKRGAAAVALIAIASILAVTSVVVGDHASETRTVSNLADANLTSTRTITDTRSASATSLILVVIIVFVLLFPDLRGTRPGAIDVGLQGETAGFHGRLDVDIAYKLASSFLP